MNLKKSLPELKLRRFTLVEVLVAVTILIIMMGMILYILSSAQRSFRLQESKTLMFQKSRMVFDLIEKDVRSMVTSQTEDQEIGYYVFPYDASDPGTRLAVCMVTSSDPGDGSKSKLSEVTYSFHNSTDEPDDRFLLRRQVVNESHTADWNFVGQPTNWQFNLDSGSPGFETIVGGVAGFKINFFNLDGSAAVVGDNTSQPVRAVVNLDLFDESMSGAEFDSKRDMHTRSFTKVFYIGHIHSR